MKPSLRKLLRRLLWLLVLLLLLAAAEYASVLWLDHRSTHYLVPGETNGSPAWVDNPLFPLRFALPRAAGLPPPMAAVRDSEDRAYRVAVLTDSTPLGPAPDSASFSFPRQLEALLRARLPDIPVEVHHLTIPSANSHVLREIARDLPLLRPDAVIVLCGNDELDGPCGPCAPPAVAPAPWPLHPGPVFARPFVLFSRLRLAQAITALACRLAPDRADRAVWQTREPQLLGPWLRPDAPALADAREAYSDNLDAIFALASAASPTVIACTTPVNLRDCPPVASAWSPDPDTSQLDREALFRAAANEALIPDESVRLCESILHRTPAHAEALYLSARLALRRGHADLAARQFSAARDNDLFRRRCDSTFNLLLANAADRADVHFLDAAALFAEKSPDRVPGCEYFLDAVHMTFEGHHLLATALFDTLSSLGALPDGTVADIPPSSGTSPAPLPDAPSLADAMLYHPWGRAADLAATLAVLREPPYRDLPFRPAAVARVAEEKARADAQVAALSSLATAVHARRLAADPDAPHLALPAALNLLRANHPAAAAAPAAAAVAAWPHRPDIRALPVVADLLARDHNAEIEEAIRAAAAADSAWTADLARLSVLFAADIENDRMVKEVRRDARNFDDLLKDRVNDAIAGWVADLPESEAVRADAPWPADLVAALRAAKPALDAADAAVLSASNALDAATADLKAVQDEHAEAVRKAEAATADFRASQAALEKARTSASPADDPLAASQALADLIRKTDQLQSLELSARTSAQMIAQRIPPAEDAVSARRADLGAARSARDAVARDLGGALRDLRRAYLKARANAISALPDTGDDRVDWLASNDPWGVPYPETLALAARASAQASRRLADASAPVRTEMLAVEEAVNVRRRAVRDLELRRLFDEKLPSLFHPAPGAPADTSKPTPVHLAAAMAVGDALAARDRPALAVPWYAWVLAASPLHPAAAVELARSLRLLEHPEEAIDVLRPLADRLPSDPDVLEALGFHLLIHRDDEEAETAWTRADTLIPYRYSRFFWRAYAMQEIRNTIPAWRTIRRYLEFYPGSPEALSLRSEIEPYLPDDFNPDEKPAASSKPSLLDTLKE